MALYKLHKNLQGEVNSVIKECGTVGTAKHRLHIPFVSDNTDYQEYLEWLKIDGNEPEAADQ